MGLASLAAFAGRYNVSLSYHINLDEAYQLYNSTPNENFVLDMCRRNTDHETYWASAFPFQEPSPGLHCSISKTKDMALYGRFERYGKLLSTVPPGLRTLHTDAWRNVNSDWGPWQGDFPGYIGDEIEDVCGTRADVAFFQKVGVSLGNEGPNGMPADYIRMGFSYFYHGYGTSTSGARSSREIYLVSTPTYTLARGQTARAYMHATTLPTASG